MPTELRGCGAVDAGHSVAVFVAADLKLCTAPRGKPLGTIRWPFQEMPRVSYALGCPKAAERSHSWVQLSGVGQCRVGRRLTSGGGIGGGGGAGGSKSAQRPFLLFGGIWLNGVGKLPKIAGSTLLAECIPCPTMKGPHMSDVAWPNMLRNGDGEVTHNEWTRCTAWHTAVARGARSPQED